MPFDEFIHLQLAFERFALTLGFILVDHFGK